jgi:quercetin dioxygenase-like cupin family protein
MSPTASKTLERDAVAVDPRHYSVELENDKLRVVRITYGPLEKSVMHKHPPGIGVFLTDAIFKFTYPDGKSENIEANAGEFVWFGETWEHLPENLEDAPSEVLYIELK